MTVPFLNDNDIDAALPRVLEQLRADRLIAYPTETVYGFGGAMTTAAAERLQALKHREPDKPFLLLITDLAQVPGIEWPRAARELARHFWPGPLTLAVPAKGDSFGPGVVSGDGMVALRATPHEPMRRLIRAWGAPITSSSANGPGEPPARSAAEAVAALRMLAAADVLVLDGGVLPLSQPSTVVACDENSVRVIRPGVITGAELHQRLLGTDIDVE